MSTEFAGNIRECWNIKVNGYTLFAAAWLLFWIGWMVASVHDVTTLPAGTVYGWGLPVSGAMILIPTAIISFIAGYSTREDNNHG